MEWYQYLLLNLLIQKIKSSFSDIMKSRVFKNVRALAEAQNLTVEF